MPGGAAAPIGAALPEPIGVTNPVAGVPELTPPAPAPPALPEPETLAPDDAPVRRENTSVGVGVALADPVPAWICVAPVPLGVEVPPTVMCPPADPLDPPPLAAGAAEVLPVVV